MSNRSCSKGSRSRRRRNGRRRLGRRSHGYRDSDTKLAGTPSGIRIRRGRRRRRRIGQRALKGAQQKKLSRFQRSYEVKKVVRFLLRFASFFLRFFCDVLSLRDLFFLCFVVSPKSTLVARYKLLLQEGDLQEKRVRVRVRVRARKKG